MAMREQDNNPPHFSEQHLVDCTKDTEATRELFGELKYYNNGCYGGLMNYHWDFMMRHGAMEIEDYPYNAREGKCVHDRDDIYGKVASYRAF